MARGDYRKKNIKADFEKVSNNRSKEVQKKKKDPGIPDLRKLGMKLEKHTKRTAKPSTIQELALKAVTATVDLSESQEPEAYMDEGITKKDNSRKAYYKEFKKVIDQSDVILEILDCRDPLGCRTREIEELIMNAGTDKKIILILNKIDLVPRDIVEEWIKYLRNEFPTVGFKSSTQTQRSNLGQSNVDVSMASESLLGSSECIGADTLLKLLKNYSRSENMKTSITVGVVGYPNVGKSSVINSLKRARVCNVGNTPGITKVAQAIHLDKHIKLLDCPGIVFSKPVNGQDTAQVLLRNCVKVEVLEDPIAPIDVILSKCSVEDIQKVYDIPTFTNTQEFLVHVARIRGRLLKGGVPDIENAARLVIQDWNSGRVPYFTVPPKLGITGGAHVTTQIVDGFSKEFVIDDFGAGMDIDDVGTTEATEMETDLVVEAKVTDTPLVVETRFKEMVKKHNISKQTPVIVVAREEETIVNHNQSLKRLMKKSKKEARRMFKRVEGEDMQE